MADESQVTPEEGSRLRQLLEAAQKELRELKEANAVRDSGFDHLTPRQRKIVLRELHDDKLELNAENLAKIAKELGYEKPAESDGTSNGQTDTNSTPDPDAPMSRDQLMREAMARMAGMNNAMSSGTTDQSGEVTKENFNQKLRAIDDPDEMMEFIRVHGHVGGIMDEAEAF